MRTHIDSNVGDTTGLRVNLTTDQEQLQAFDELPRELRDLVRDLPFRVSCIEILRNHRIGVPVRQQIAGLRTFTNLCCHTVWKNHFGEKIANDLWDKQDLQKPQPAGIKKPALTGRSARPVRMGA